MRGVNRFIDTKSQPSIQIYLKIHSYLFNPYCDVSLIDSHDKWVIFSLLYLLFPEKSVGFFNVKNVPLHIVNAFFFFSFRISIL